MPAASAAASVAAPTAAARGTFSTSSWSYFDWAANSPLSMASAKTSSPFSSWSVSTTSRPTSFSASITALAMIWAKRLIALIASSLPGIGKVMPSGLQLVSTTAAIGTFTFRASVTAIDSLRVSMMNTMPGSSFISLMPPRFLSSWVRSFMSRAISFLVRFSKVPSISIFSSFFRRRSDFLIVEKFVSMPPSQRLFTKNIPQRFASRSTVCWACFLVPTKRTDLPASTVLRTAS